MNMTIKEELALLNIDEVKNKDELKKAFHTASKKYHPDQVGGSKEMFQMTYSVYQNLLTILNDGNAKYILDFDKKYAINNGKPSSAICNKINKLVINTEKNLINKNDKNDIINYLNNVFFNKYEALLQEYIFNYLNNFLKYNHNDNIKQNDISAIKDDLLSNYELFDLSIENIDKILQDKLKPFYANHNNKVKIEKSKKELENYFIFKLEALKKHWENSYTDYNVYEKNKNMINFKINGMEKELYDYINENYYKIPTDEIIKGIDFKIDALNVNVITILHNDNKFQKAKLSLISFCKKMLFKKIITEEEKDNYLTQINNAKNVAVLNNIDNKIERQLYLYKVEKVKTKLNKKYERWIKINKSLETFYLEQQSQLMKILDTYPSETFLDFMSELDIKDMVYVDNIIKTYYEPKEKGQNRQ